MSKPAPDHAHPHLEQAARAAMEAARAAAPTLGIAIVFACDLGADPARGIGYVSNVARGDMMAAMRELLARWERS